MSLIKNKSGGVALILVIWIMVILIAIVGEFSYSMRTEINITRNFKEEEEAYQLALAGIEYAKIEILSAKNSTYVYLNENGILAFGGEDENPVREIELGRGRFSYTIIDEERRLNINSISLPQLKHIIGNSGVEMAELDTIVDSIIDWRDTNNLHMLNGAEEDYYQSLPEPYSSKDNLFDVIDELLLVKGVTSEIFYGIKEEEKEYTGIAQYLTTWSSNLINVNTAHREVLETVFGTAVAENIISQREASPILSPVSGGTVMSSFYTITSTGTIGEGKIKRTINATVKRNGDKLDLLYWNDNFRG